MISLPEGGQASFGLSEEMLNGATPDLFLLAGGSSGITLNSNRIRALSKMIWFPDKSMLEAKLVAGASELVELVKDGQLEVALGTISGIAGAMALAWMELAGSLRLLSPPAQRTDAWTREDRASGSASSTRMDVLGILAASWAEVSSPRIFADGAPRPTGMAKVGTSSGWPESITGS